MFNRLPHPTALNENTVFYAYVQNVGLINFTAWTKTMGTSGRLLGGPTVQLILGRKFHVIAFNEGAQTLFYLFADCCPTLRSLSAVSSQNCCVYKTYTVFWLLLHSHTLMADYINSPQCRNFTVYDITVVRSSKLAPTLVRQSVLTISLLRVPGLSQLHCLLSDCERLKAWGGWI